MLKKGDFVIITAVIAAAVLSFLVITGLHTDTGKRVIIYKDKRVIYNLSLYENAEIEIGENTLTIKDGYVYMSYASCKNQICVNHKKISKSGESIVCLPGKISAEVE